MTARCPQCGRRGVGPLEVSLLVLLTLFALLGLLFVVIESAAYLS